MPTLRSPASLEILMQVGEVLEVAAPVGSAATVTDPVSFTIGASLAGDVATYGPYSEPMRLVVVCTAGAASYRYLQPGEVAALAVSQRGTSSGSLVLTIGTSLMQQNDVATASKISRWARGWMTWAMFFSRGRMVCPIWHDPTVYPGWEPSGTPGATRYFRGLNCGVSGQTIGQIAARRGFIGGNIKPSLVIIDAGTNDMGSLSKEAIHAGRVSIAQYVLSLGVPVIMLPILSRGVSSWAAGGLERKKAAWITHKTREFCDSTPNCKFFDWNRLWVDSANANGEPFSGYSLDAIHFSPPGGVAVGEAFAAFVSGMLPDPAPRVWSADDLYDATYNPLGNLLANPFCTGTAGTVGTGITGTVATGMRAERSAGDATGVASKETRTDNRGDWQVLTITPGATASLLYFRTTAADTAHTLPAGTWVEASIEVDIGSFNAWEGVTLYLKDNGTGGLNSYGMEPFDDGGYVKLPTRVMNGLIVTPPIQLVSGSATLRWRTEIRVGSTGGGATGTAVVKVGAVELRPVADPRTIVNYRAG